VKITVKTHYACDYCPKVYHRRADRLAHERHCWHNPSRLPREGEVHGVRHRAFFGDAVPPWCPPTVGVIFLDGCWVDVPGYQLLADARVLAQLRAGHNPELVENWPEPCTDGYSFTGMRRADRIAFVRHLLAKYPVPFSVTTRTSWAELIAEIDCLADASADTKGPPCSS
jgi:hypothetical protein